MGAQSSIKSRFMRFVSTPNEYGCWLWNGADKHRYGKFWDGTKYDGAHRVSYRIHKGEIQDGKVVMHKCDTPQCVNPDHLEIGTHSENTLDSVIKGRSNREIRARGSKSGRAILNEENVVEILQSKDTTASLARKFGVSFMTVSAVRHNKSWKHIER